MTLNYEKKKGYWGPLAEQEWLRLSPTTSSRDHVKLPSLSGDYMALTVNNIMNQSKQLTTDIMSLAGMRTRVMKLLHEFVARVYYESAFGGLAETVFERFRSRIDASLADRCGDVLTKLPYIYDRLRDGDPETMSQGLNTCRRIIDAFADVVFPPQQGEVDDGRSERKGRTTSPPRTEFAPM